MNIKKVLKDLFFLCALYYTAISVAVMIVSLTLARSGDILLYPAQFFKILLFSFVMALGSAFVRIPKISRPIAVCLHSVCYIVGFFVFVMLCGTRLAPAVIFTAIFAFFYAVINLIISKIRSNGKGSQMPTKKDRFPKAKKSKRVKEDYQSQFSSNKD